MADTPARFLVRHLRRVVSPPVPRPPGDAELLHRYRVRGDQSAFAELLRRHGPMVLGVCRRVLGRLPDAEDAFQATFVVLARRAGSLRQPEALAAWLHGVAVRTARAARRRRPRPTAPLPAACTDRSEGPAEAASWGEVRRVLDEELGRLPARCRAVLVLCYLDGLTRDEAAQRLGWSLATVKRCLDSGRRILRQRLVRRGVGPVGLALAALAPQGLRASVPPALAATTLQAAYGAAPAAVAGLASQVCRSGWLGKWMVTAATLAVLGAALAAGAGHLALAPNRQPDATTEGVGKPDADRTDLYGDPLPPGALARFGTLRNRPASSDLAVTPDGQTVVTCSYRGRVLRFYDAATGRLRRTLQLPGAGEAQSVLSPDGRFVAVPEGVFGMTVWETGTGKQVHAFAGGRDDVIHTAGFSADGRTLAVVNGANECRLLDLATGKVRELGAPGGRPICLAFSPDGKRLALVMHDRTVLCLETRTGRRLWRTRAECAQRMAFSTDGRVLVLARMQGGADADLLLLDAATGKPLGRDRTPPDEGFCSDCVAAGGVLALLLPKRAVVWDLKAGKERASLAGMGWADGACNRLALTGHGKEVFTLGDLLQRWDLATGRPLYADTSRLGHTRPLETVAYSPDGKWVASAASNRAATVYVWDARTSRLVHTLPGHGDFPHTCLCFTGDSKGLILAGSDNVVHVWDLAVGKEVGHWAVGTPGDKRHDEYLAGLRLADDGKTLVTLTLDPSDGPLNGRSGTVSFWDVATGKRLRSRPGVKPLYAAAVSPDGRLAALEGGEVVDLATGAERWTLQAGEDTIGFGGNPAFAFSPDGVLAAGALSRRTTRDRVNKVRMRGLQVWELLTGRPVVRLDLDEEMEDGCRFVFTPDGGRLLTVGPRTIRLWDVLTGREVFRRAVADDLLGPPGCPFALAPDGHAVATGQPDTTVMLWDLSAAGRPAAPAPLTDRQRDRLWADLAADDPVRGYAALLELAARPGQAVALLRDRLRPAEPVAAEAVRRWVDDLDSPDFARRDRASRYLAERGSQVERALREALPRSPSPEARRRIEALLEDVRTPHGDELRGVRAVYVLRRLGMAEARQVLARLSCGDPRARVSQEARAALRP
jgi:RNA polymerase sigma factor (sigma-70 family)